MTPAEAAGERDRVADLTRVFDPVIEVIDPATGELVVSQRVDPLLVGFAGERHVVGYRVDEWGVPGVHPPERPPTLPSPHGP